LGKVGSCELFSLGWPGPAVLQISAFLIARIAGVTGVSHGHLAASVTSYSLPWLKFQALVPLLTVPVFLLLPEMCESDQGRGMASYPASGLKFQQDLHNLQKMWGVGLLKKLVSERRQWDFTSPKGTLGLGPGEEKAQVPRGMWTGVVRERETLQTWRESWLWPRWTVSSACRNSIVCKQRLLWGPWCLLGSAGDLGTQGFPLACRVRG
jgi:hypothetical protein